MNEVALSDVAILLRPEDDVAVLKRAMSPEAVIVYDRKTIAVRSEIGPGHKVALRKLKRDEPVRKYGQIIGYATDEIEPGDWVHTHNLGLAPTNGRRDDGGGHAQGGLKIDYQFCVDYKPVDYYPPEQIPTFMGYKRREGRVGTRNYVALISTVNCSATTTQMICDAFHNRLNLRTGKRTRATKMRAFPNVDGVIPIVHKGG